MDNTSTNAKAKLDVPFYKSIKDTDCGPLALKMALEYLSKQEYSFEDVAREEKQLPTGLVWSAGIARAAKRFGFSVKFISTTNFSLEENDIDYYKKYSNDAGKLLLKELHQELKALKVDIIEKDMVLDELLKYVSKESIPIVLVNWKVIAEKPGFSGHFLTLTGYDSKNVYVHNPGLANPEAFMKIPRDKFMKAWEFKGTDKDTIIVFRKLKK